MTDRELMQQALEAMEEIADEVFSAYDNKLGEVILALRERLAQPTDANPDPLHLSRILHELAGAASLCWTPHPSGVFDSQEAIKHVESAIAEIRERLAQPEQEPLTDKRITQVIDSMPNKFAGFMVDWDLYEFTRAIEAARGIKEKNNG